MSPLSDICRQELLQRNEDCLGRNAEPLSTKMMWDDLTFLDYLSDVFAMRRRVPKHLHREGIQNGVLVPQLTIAEAVSNHYEPVLSAGYYTDDQEGHVTRRWRTSPDIQHKQAIEDLELGMNITFAD